MFFPKRNYITFAEVKVIKIFMMVFYNKIFPGYQTCQLVTRRKRTISVLIFRVLMYLENQSVSDIGLPEFHIYDGELANGSCWLVLRACCIRPASFDKHAIQSGSRPDAASLDTSQQLPLASAPS
jgi:hypothetical protein